MWRPSPWWMRRTLWSGGPSLTGVRRMFDNDGYLYRLMTRGISLLALLCLLASHTLAVQTTDTKKTDTKKKKRKPASATAAAHSTPTPKAVPARVPAHPVAKTRLRPLPHFD